MSQPQDFGPNYRDPLAARLKNISELIALFYDCQKACQNQMLGIEYEMFGRDTKHNRPLAYEGPISISSFFEHLVERSAQSDDPYRPLYEGDHIVALSGKRAIIALEPGGQIEIAAHPQSSLEAVNEHFLSVAKELDTLAKECGITLFALGIHPLATRDEMAQVKKRRYGIMREYMGHLAGLGLDMMTRSAAIQLNIDYTSETDMVAKMRLANRLVPFFSLLCSSASFIEGQPSPHALLRGYVWQETDPARTGIPAVVFAPDFGYETWINWALDVPMYFIRRGNNYINVAGMSFRHFMAHGYQGEHAQIRDFVDHLSTIFTEVRLKPYIEIRSPDSLPVPYVKALATFTWILFYGDNAFKKASLLLDSLDHQALCTLHRDAIRLGKRAIWNGKNILETAGELLQIAQQELELGNNTHKDILRPFFNLVENNTTISEILKNKFNTIDTTNLASLIDMLTLFKTVC